MSNISLFGPIQLHGRYITGAFDPDGFIFMSSALILPDAFCGDLIIVTIGNPPRSDDAIRAVYQNDKEIAQFLSRNKIPLSTIEINRLSTRNHIIHANIYDEKSIRRRYHVTNLYAESILLNKRQIEYINSTLQVVPVRRLYNSSNATHLLHSFDILSRQVA